MRNASVSLNEVRSKADVQTEAASKLSESITPEKLHAITPAFERVLTTLKPGAAEYHLAPHLYSNDAVETYLTDPSRLTADLSSAAVKIEPFVGSDYSQLDADMAEAERLLTSESMEDQINGMKLMLRVQNLFSQISNFISTQAKLQKEALDNSRLS